MNWTLENRAELEAVKLKRQSWAERVLKELEDKLPQDRLVVILDQRDNDDIRNNSGRDNRGLFWPLNEYDRPDMQRTFDLEMATCDPSTGRLDYTLDAVIYLHNTSCAEETGLTMTLAHELQHFIQHYNHQESWAFNTLAANLSPETLQSLGLTWASIPIEHEARIVAKCVSEKLLGASRTAAYIEMMEKRQLTASDAQDWAFVKSLDTRRNIHLPCQTVAFFQELKSISVRNELADRLADRRDMREFARLNLGDVFKQF